MKESIKKILSVFMATCMVLPSSICYAGKGNSKNPPAELCLDVDEKKLQALRMDIYTLIKNERPPYKGAVTHFGPLKSRCISIKDDEELSSKFVEFYARFVESGGSANSVYDGTILFLSIIDHLERSAFPEDSNRDFCLWVAFITLNICTFRDDGLYRDWYKLLAPYMPPKFLKSFDRKRFKEQLSHIMTGADRLDEATRLMARLYKESGVQGDGVDLITEKVFDRISPFLRIFTRAEKAVKRLKVGNISEETVKEAEEAVTQYENEISKYERGMRETLVGSRDTIAAMRSDIRDSKAKLELMQEGYARIKQVERECIERMLLEKTPESVAAAEIACEKYSRWLERNGDMFFALSEMLMSKIDDDSKDLIKWVKYHIRTIKPCMDKLDYCVQALKTEFSDEAYEEALRAQEEFKKVLSDYKPEASNQSVFMVDAEKVTSLQALSDIIHKPPVTPEVAKELEELQDYLAKNQSLIAKIKREREDAEATERRNREYKQKTEDWNKLVADKKVSKKQEEQTKRCAAESKDDPEEKAAFELVFLHAPCEDEQYDPLKFFKKKSRHKHIEEWNMWVDEALKGTPLGTTIKRNPYIPIYKKSGCDLKITRKSGRPEICEYRGGGELKNTSKGFRILYYMEEDTNCVVVLYVGKPFGESHDNPWETLEITPDWIFKPIGKIVS